MTQLWLLGSDAVNPQQHDKGEEPLVIVLGHAWASIALSHSSQPIIRLPTISIRSAYHRAQAW
jgi:hypothetical protein